MNVDQVGVLTSCNGTSGLAGLKFPDISHFNWIFSYITSRENRMRWYKEEFIAMKRVFTSLFALFLVFSLLVPVVYAEESVEVAEATEAAVAAEVAATNDVSADTQAVTTQAHSEGVLEKESAGKAGDLDSQVLALERF